LLWLGYLAYLVVTTPREPVVLSRPQFLVADLVVIARVDGFTEPVVIEEVISAGGAEAENLPKKIKVINLAMCGPPAHLQKKPGQKDFTGPGRYILPLRVATTKKGDDVVTEYFVAETPPAPGYPSPGPPRSGPPRIYPLTAETRAQLRHMAR